MNFTKTENIVADIRNKLTPFWNLVGIILDGSYLDSTIVNEANNAKSCQSSILDNLKEIEAMDTKRIATANAWVETNYPDSPFKKDMVKIFLAGMNHNEPISGRSYDTILPTYGRLYDIEDWLETTEEGYITNDDGYGYWVKNGFMYRGDEVFSSDQEDATHVIWFNN